MILSIKHWKRFQHFKDRRPPWIKLYRELLDDDEFYNLSPVAAKTLVLLWLLASEDETGAGTLPPIKKIAFRVRMSEKSILSIISELSHWLRQDDITMISPRYQDGPSEAEAEAYKKEAYKKEAEVIAVQVSQKPSPPPTDDAWLLSLKQNQTYDGIDIDRELGKCKAWCDTNKKLFSRRRFVNWINRAERPLAAAVGSQFQRGVQDFLSRHGGDE